MTYKLIWTTNSVCIDYYDDIDNKEIIEAHYEVNNDERFYNCNNLIIDITKCNMDRVKVPGLSQIVGLDLGNLISRNTFKIAMIANDPENMEKAKGYIKLFKHASWKIDAFRSIEDTNIWLNS